MHLAIGARDAHFIREEQGDKRMKRFGTEDYFGQYEFNKPYQLASSDCESISIAELIELGGGTFEEFLNTKLGYPEMPGSRTLRKAISGLYTNVSEDQILVLGSPVEGIYLSMRALVKAEDHVVVLSPAYDALFNVAEHISANATRWFLQHDGQKWSLDFDRLDEILRPNTKLLVVNFPHNPTGFVPSRADLERLVAVTRRYGIRMFSDEIYSGLEFNPDSRSQSLADQMSNGLILGGASKGLGLPGLRFGWLVVKEPHLYNELLNLKSYTSMCSHQANEYLGLMAVHAAPNLLKKNLDIITGNLQVAEGFFKTHAGRMNWLRPLGGSVSVVKINDTSAEKFCHKMAADFGVVLLPIKYMGYDDQYFRMGFGRTSFRANLEAFDRALTTI